MARCKRVLAVVLRHCAGYKPTLHLGGLRAAVVLVQRLATHRLEWLLEVAAHLPQIFPAAAPHPVQSDQGG